MSSGPTIDWSKYENKAATAAPQIDFSKYEDSPTSDEPSFYQKLTAVDQTTQNPALRYLSNAGAALIATPGAIASTVLDPFGTGVKIRKSVSDAIDAYSNPATRPSWEGIKSVLPEALGLGTGNVAGGKAVGAIASGAVQAAKSLVPGAIPEYFYRTALKPPTTLPAARSAAMVQTGLQNAIPVSAAGLEKIGGLIDDLNDKIQNTVDTAQNQGATVNKFAVASRLSDTAKQFKTQVNPNTDLNTISESGNEFLENQPNEIPASQAQALKVGTYKQLKSAAYGSLKPAAVESQKALARGIKEELVNQFPELKDFNAQDSKFIDLEGVLEKAVGRTGNNNAIGIGAPLMAGAVKAGTGSSGLAAVAGTLKGVIANPMVRSRLAIALARRGVSLSGTNGALSRIATYSAALDAVANAGQNGGQENQ